MTVESATYVNQLDITLPSNTDFLHEGDNHITLVKKTLKNTFSTSNKQYNMDTIAGGIVPIGAIIMWSLTSGSIPAGWAICDGRTVARTDGGGNITTPDLVGKFPMAAEVAGSTGGAFTKTINTTTNGAHAHSNPLADLNGGHDHGGLGTGFHALTIAQLPVHDHGGGNHSHEYFIPNIGVSTDGSTTSAWRAVTAAVTTGASGTIINPQGSGLGHNHSITFQGGHQHSIGDTSSAGDHNHSITVDVTPPFYQLIFIMKH
jgi:hypothetical protein